MLCSATLCYLANFAPIQAPDYDQKIYDMGYTCASYLSDPLLKAHSWRWQIPITHKLHENASRVEICVRKAMYGLGAVTTGLCSVASSTAGVLLRHTFINIQKHPFLHCTGQAPEKSFNDQFSLLSWNLCCIPGGYPITDGSVLPWNYRIKNIIQAIQKENKDVVCLCEIFDIHTAHDLIKGLASSYTHFYYCVGPKTVGPSSGLFIASKFRIEDPSFAVFPREALCGRAKFSNKGVFSFDIKNESGQQVRIFATHLGHSEVPNNPTLEELTARKKELDLILNEMEQHKHKIQILTGDLNMDPIEFQNNKMDELFDRGLIKSVGATWGGDKYSAENIVGKKGSDPTTLDYTMIRHSQELNASITTTYLETGFDGEDFRLHALSDHKGLCSEITLKH